MKKLCLNNNNNNNNNSNNTFAERHNAVASVALEE